MDFLMQKVLFNTWYHTRNVLFKHMQSIEGLLKTKIIRMDKCKDIDAHSKMQK
jgi:hypothetical protein